MTSEQIAIAQSIVMVALLGAGAVWVAVKNKWK